MEADCKPPLAAASSPADRAPLHIGWSVSQPTDPPSAVQDQPRRHALVPDCFPRLDSVRHRQLSFDDRRTRDRESWSKLCRCRALSYRDISLKEPAEAMRISDGYLLR